MNQEQVRSKLWYEPDSGIFYRILKNGLKVAGTKRKDGYIRIWIGYKGYYAHQLAWLYQTGSWCRNVDHKDTNKSNNKWSNLRSATYSEQQFNQKNLKCYYYDKKAKVYRPLIQIAGKKYYGKSCKTEEEAKVIANDMKIKHHGVFHFGEQNG